MNESPVKNIKTREVKHDIKVLDKAAEAAKNMKQTTIRTKDQMQNLMDDGQISPEEYAEDKMRYAAEDTASEAGHQMKNTAKKTTKKVRKRVRDRREQKLQEKQMKQAEESRRTVAEAEKQTAETVVEESQEGPLPRRKNNTAPKVEQATFRQREYGVQQHEARVRRLRKAKVTVTEVEAGRTAQTTAKEAKKAAPKAVNGTIKATKKTVKTAERTGATVKTSQAAAATAAKAAKQTAETAKRSAIIMRKAAEASRAAAVAVAKGVASAVKGIIAAVKSLIALLIAGASSMLMILVPILLVGLLVGSIFGIFFSSEDTGSETTMRSVVQGINQDYQQEIDDLKNSGSYDSVEMSGSTAVWKEVLSIYTVRTTNDEEEAQEVASLDDNKINILTDIFWEMNDISSRTETRTETVIVETDDGNGNIVEETREETKTVLLITVTHKTATEMAETYGFNEEQKQQLAELLDEKNRSMWASVLYGIRAGDSDIVEVALSQVGQVGGQPYWSWYGFDNRVEWCACFVSWCANECGYIEDGIIPKYAGCVNGVQWFKDRDQWIDGSQEPLPGMIIFYDWDSPDGESGPQDGESDHTGIVQRVEDGIVYTVEGNSGDSCRIRQHPVGYYEILGYGCPAY